MTAYHPSCVLADIIKYRDDSALFTLEIYNERPQALFLHCSGTGADTIVFESDIRTTAYMYLDGLPKYLVDHYGYRVKWLIKCIKKCISEGNFDSIIHSTAITLLNNRSGIKAWSLKDTAL